MKKYSEWIGKTGFGFSLVPMAALLALALLNPG